METSLIIIKPDAIERSIAGDVLARLEKKGLKIIGLKMMTLDDSIIDEHYAHQKDKAFFPTLKAYMKRTPVIIVALRGINAVASIRNIVGATNPLEAVPGSIRGDFALTLDGNIIHASDSPETALVELDRFFKGKDIYDYKKISDDVI